MKLKEHTRNQKRMYRIHKQDEKIHDLELMIGKLQQENKQLKMINKEYERLNKESGKGFKITAVQEYNIDELLSYKKYKDNWNKLREWIVYNKHNENTEQHYLVVDYGTLLGKMQELEKRK